jgi:hypothetical protein
LSTYHAILYLHFLFLFAGVGTATIMVLCTYRLHAAGTLEQAVPWGMLAGKTKNAFPVVVLGLFGTGAYMTSDLWTWGTGWIWPSIVGLALVGLQGPLIAGPRADALKKALQENGPGPLGERARRLARDPRLWTVTLANPAMVFAIAWNMTQKPGTAAAIASIVIAYAVGALVAMRMTRMPAAEASPAAKPAS